MSYNYMAIERHLNMPTMTSTATIFNANIIQICWETANKSQVTDLFISTNLTLTKGSKASSTGAPGKSSLISTMQFQTKMQLLITNMSILHAC